MEKTRNSVIYLFKNCCRVISNLVNGGEVDDVELTGELAKDPMEALKEYEAFVKSVKEPVQARTQNCKEVQTREASAVKRPTKRATPKEAPEPTIEPVNDDGREI